MSQIAQYQGTGKRKTSVARVILRPGDGSTWINGRTIEEYFPRQVLQALATAPLRVAGVEGKFDLRARLHGGRRVRVACGRARAVGREVDAPRARRAVGAPDDEHGQQ